ncbi:hypothetical protein [Geomesophilobacter sediminis]|nr:hypothetical protein [Geomesophilobacter sediminis]
MCPYYAKNEDYCDVGCGYISSCDVKTIIRYCMRSHADCLKYRELTDRGIRSTAILHPHSAPAR